MAFSFHWWQYMGYVYHGHIAAVATTNGMFYKQLTNNVSHLSYYDILPIFQMNNFKSHPNFSKAVLSKIMLCFL